MASEQAEKRLKATLAAKRDPSAASRVASPATNGDSTPSKDISSEEGKDSKSAAPPADAKGDEDVAMEGVETSPAKPQSPWIHELEVLFDSVKQILPKMASEIIG